MLQNDIFNSMYQKNTTSSLLIPSMELYVYFNNKQFITIFKKHTSTRTCFLYKCMAVRMYIHSTLAYTTQTKTIYHHIQLHERLAYQSEKLYAAINTKLR